jgi:phosphoribosyl-ATP pyrophosphohydrolase/phosphoribosyl-AMP cyclohydrolase
MLNINDIQLDFSKSADGLIPAIVQDAQSLKVLMLGYMNYDALKKTLEEKKVTFYSRSKKRLWTKGETSEHYLHLVDILVDCDNDCILIKALPAGPVCHTGNDTCFNETSMIHLTQNRMKIHHASSIRPIKNKLFTDEKNKSGILFLQKLESIIENRRKEISDKSYVSSLFKKGINKIAQKVGEEAIEVVIEAKDINDELFKNEAADLLFHLLILLQARGFRLEDIVKVLEERHSEKEEKS